MILAIDPGLATLGWAVLDRNGAVHDVGVLISKSSAKRLGKNADRVARLRVQVEQLAAIAKRWPSIDTLAAEAMSFPRGRIAAIVSLSLSWGALIAFASALELKVRQVPPKTWQSAIAPGATTGGAIDYDKVFDQLAAYLGEQDTARLVTIAKAHRTHVLDAIGVGVFAAMRPEVEDVARKRRRA